MPISAVCGVLPSRVLFPTLPRTQNGKSSEILVAHFLQQQAVRSTRFQWHLNNGPRIVCVAQEWEQRGLWMSNAMEGSRMSIDLCESGHAPGWCSHHIITLWHGVMSRSYINHNISVSSLGLHYHPSPLNNTIHDNRPPPPLFFYL